MKTGKIEKALRKSPINYFSDLFIVAMVLGWIVVLFIMVVVAIYVTLVNADTSMWSDIANLVAIPLSCGGAIWMIKNSVQHAIANNRGERAHMDFPKVNADGEADGNEEMVNTENKTESEETVG
jgi:hypothetical protein